MLRGECCESDVVSPVVFKLRQERLVKFLHHLMDQRGCRDQVVAAIKLLRRSSCCDDGRSVGDSRVSGDRCRADTVVIGALTGCTFSLSIRVDWKERRSAFHGGARCSCWMAVAVVGA
jgi:hypothetical protein